MFYNGFAISIISSGLSIYGIAVEANLQKVEATQGRIIYEHIFQKTIGSIVLCFTEQIFKCIRTVHSRFSYQGVVQRLQLRINVPQLSLSLFVTIRSQGGDWKSLCSSLVFIENVSLCFVLLE